ncbi:threonine-phosphate decarboxylase CobD [Anaeroselena agilis]|uniref:threonine-phosphate decarboxylase n=1 Tax=Anaeroselena agilis TaxID=3063788 RepID=A0ABU3NY56_9FIRM|nr:threonine-phosphate decarboxylase CobD [Selenomonadales bacterium 4137-cl]
MNTPGPFEHGGNIYAAARLTGAAPGQLLDYSANINPLGLSAAVRDAVRDALDSVIHYPDATAAALKDAIGRRYGVDPGLVTCGNGAAELLYVLCQVRRPRRVLLAAPTFSEYERAARAAGAAVGYFPLAADDGFRLDPDAFAARLAGVDIAFLCNPNNPTGRLLTRGEVEPIVAAAARAGAWVVVDESFLDFLSDAAGFTCRPLLAAYPNLIILQSLTKFYAIPGLRLGFLLAEPAVGDILDRAKDPWNVNTLAQAAGVAALDDEAYRAASVAAVAAARAELIPALAALPGLRPFPASANFILARLTGATAPDLRRTMLRDGILIRDCSNYPGLSPAYIRLAVKLPAQNAALLAALEKNLKDGTA